MVCGGVRGRAGMGARENQRLPRCSPALLGPTSPSSPGPQLAPPRDEGVGAGLSVTLFPSRVGGRRGQLALWAHRRLQARCRAEVWSPDTGSMPSAGGLRTGRSVSISAGPSFLGAPSPRQLPRPRGGLCLSLPSPHLASVHLQSLSKDKTPLQTDSQTTHPTLGSHSPPLWPWPESRHVWGPGEGSRSLSQPP